MEEVGSEYIPSSRRSGCPVEMRSCIRRLRRRLGRRSLSVGSRRMMLERSGWDFSPKSIDFEDYSHMMGSFVV
jgi:hypothetical protein